MGGREINRVDEEEETTVNQLQKQAQHCHQPQ
jgi:hypothetical protein